MTDKKDEAFRLTPKGFLSMKLGVDISPLWDELANFVKEEAARNGMTDGVPCLVMVDGGHCITAGKSK